MEREIILVSACLLGEACRYDGKSKEVKGIIELSKYYDIIPICPEVMGGLSIPRYPAEIVDGRVINKKGNDVTRNYEEGAYWSTVVAKEKNIKLAVLKENSPSCGVKKIHDGKFTGKLIDGEGVTTKRLRRAGVKVINEDEALKLLEELKKE